MALISSGIDRVRAFELPCGIWAGGGSVGVPRVALVKWYSCWLDKFYQVYVNGQYAGATVDSQQRQMVVQLSTSLKTPARIEVFAVEADQANIDFSNEVDIAPAQSGRVRMTFLRGQNLPAGSVAQIYFDNGTGQVDYDNPLSPSPVRIWSAWQDKAGFGMSRFGESDFGYGSAAAVGFGAGSFGRGQFGLDADTFEWVSPPLQSGVYKFAVKVSDDTGNESVASETGQITVNPAARPAEELAIRSFDRQTNELILNIS